MAKTLKIQYEELPGQKDNPGTDYCRKLLKAGEKPNTRLECYRGERLDIVFPHIGNAAKWLVRDRDDKGLAYARHVPLPEKFIKKEARS